MQRGNRTSRLAVPLIAVILFAALGLASGRWLPALACVSVAYLAWQLYHAWRLQGWLEGREGGLPESFGAWSDIFRRLGALQEQSRERQQQLRDAVEEFQAVTNAFPDAILVLDENDNITWFNQAAQQLLELQDPDDRGQPVTNLIRNPDFADWLPVQDRVESRLDMPCPHKDHIRLAVSAVPFREGQRLLVFRDVTDIHNLERVRRDFVANVSHELRTPLTVLLGYLEALADDCPDDMRQAVQGMQGHATQVQALLEDLLNLSRLQSDERPREEQAVDMPALLMRLKEQAEDLSQGRHRFLFEIQPDLWLRGNAEDLESAFRNLLGNAVNYTPAGGTVTVRWEATGGELVLSVSDTGIGIPHRDIPRLTERFYRVGAGRSRNTGGTGLGLSIVKHVLNAHQAQLHIDSELGAGSRFSCRFPADRLAPAARRTAAP